MKLPNELTGDKAASFALAWSISWRFFVLFFIIGLLSFLVPIEEKFEYVYTLAIIELLITFLIFWFWVHRLLKKGIGNVRIIFMEKEHYEELSKSLGNSEKL